MFPRVDDNSQEAFQFLSLGAGIVLLLRLVWWLVDRQLTGGGTGPDDLFEALRNGYLVGPDTVVAGGVSLPGRLAIAALTTLAGGLILSVAGGWLARGLHGEPIRAAVRGARWGMLVVGAWALYAVLFLPPVSARISEEGVRIRQRSALLGEVALPLTASERMIPWSELGIVEARTVSSGYQGCNTQEEVVLRMEQEDIVLARIVPGTKDCATSTALARQHMQRLTALLTARSKDGP